MLMRRIFHPSDFSEASNVAFAHALKVAVAARCGLTIFHTGSLGVDDDWKESSGIRQTLERWELLPPDSPEEAIASLGLNVEKVVLPFSDVLHSIRHFLSLKPHDLIVLTTHQHDGYERWMYRQVAEPLARKAAEMTLFIPQGTEGFISAETGDVHLDSVLIPADLSLDPRPAMESAAALADLLGCGEADATVLHVNERVTVPRFGIPEASELKWRWMHRSGNVEEEILRAAQEYHADLIVMATQGHRGFIDALRGNTTERIVRQATCPVLAVPSYVPEPVPVIAEDLATGRLVI